MAPMRFDLTASYEDRGTALPCPSIPAFGHQWNLSTEAKPGVSLS